MEPRPSGPGDDTESGWVVAVGQLLVRIAAQPPPPLHWPEAAAARIRREQAASEGRDTMEFLCADTEPSLQTCPDCGGTLWQARGSRPPRHACHTGHVLSEHVLRSAVRVLRERAALQRELQALERLRGNGQAAWLAGHEASAARHQADGLVRSLKRATFGTGMPG